ncbi:trypsin-like serine peptidase [Streptomyces sp. NPDC058659]|uniref:trypsin-like serine peptidase n=1 Tax=unclassified Streptomyces TaxID=2593676 RepID=UPI00365FD196
MKKRELVHRRMSVLAVALAAVTATTVGSAPAVHAAGPAELRLVPLGAGYEAGLQQQVGYWNLNRLSAASLNGDGSEGVAPAAGWDDTARPWTGGGKTAKTVGKLVMRMRNADGASTTDGLAACTATVVQSRNKSVVVTAAHCLRVNWGLNAPLDLNQIATNVLFVPDFRGENLPRVAPGTDLEQGPAIGPDVAPYGVWAVTRAWLTEGWAAQSNHFNNNDMVAMVVDNPSDDRPVEEVVGGGQPIGFNPARTTPRTNFGYPAVNFKSYSGPNFSSTGAAVINGSPNVNNVPAAQQRIYDGRSLMFSQGPSWINREWWWDTNSDLMKTQLSPGSSGGPWFKDFDHATGEGVLVGVTSHFAQSSTGGLDAIAEAEGRAPSPYMAGTNFGDQEKAAFETAQSVTPGA